ncbi:MAG: DUF1850 domain-containing protein [Spirochaetales bacterium]|nr:MAG: DUF1850 domain-containing protein [Spirochaetales bacterium]
MRSFKRICISILILMAAFAYRTTGRFLRITAEDGRPIATIPAKNGFDLSFIHSINLSPVDEEFTMRKNGILVLDKVSFDQFGTGMPTSKEDGVRFEGGRYVTKPARRFKEIPVRVSPVPGHELRIDGRRYALTRWAPPSGLLLFIAAPGYDRMAP